MKIVIDDLSGGEVLALLEEHISDMYATSPPESVHALDVNALKASNITFLVPPSKKNYKASTHLVEIVAVQVKL